MLDKKLYTELERELEKCRIEDAVEDVLLSLSEALEDKGAVGKEQTYQETQGSTKLQITGIYEGEEGGVYIRTFSINGNEFAIEDYLL